MFETRQENPAMHHHNTVFHTLQKLVPWRVFDRLVETHQADRRVRRLRTRNQFLALLYAQLAGAESLRAIEAAFESHAARLYHVGAKEVSRSTLADANAKRPYEVFAALLAEMMKRCERKLADEVADAVYLVDSTRFPLTSLSGDWAKFSSGINCFKLHVVYNPDTENPTSAEVSAGNVNDITVAKSLPIRPGATYVFDLGYYDYSWWAELNEQGCRLVTRLKANTKLREVTENKVPKGSSVLSDRVGLLPERLAASRKSPFQDPIREVRVCTETGKILRIITNDLDASADEIADLYKRRWQIELFFRWVKHTLKISHFLGTSENAIRIQIAVALIAHLLLRAGHKLQNSVKSLQTFKGLITQNLMHRRRIDCLLDPPSPAEQDDRQLSLSIC